MQAPKALDTIGEQPSQPPLSQMLWRSLMLLPVPVPVPHASQSPACAALAVIALQRLHTAQQYHGLRWCILQLPCQLTSLSRSLAASVCVCVRRFTSCPVPAPCSCSLPLLPPAGKNLQAQYERWQPRAKYKMHLDPTTEDVKKLAISCRRTAKASKAEACWAMACQAATYPWRPPGI